MAPRTSIAAGVEGITAPSQGSVLDDLGRAALGFGSGLLEAQRREEERALRMAALALDAEGINVQREGLEIEREGLDVERERTDILRRQADLAKREFERQVSEEERIRTGTGSAARIQLRNRYGWEPSQAEALSDEAAVSALQHARARELTAMNNRTRILTSGIDGTLALLDNNREAMALAQEDLELQEELFQQFRENNKTDAQVLELMTQGLEREDALAQLYAQANPEGARALQEAREKFNRIATDVERDRVKLDTMLQQIGAAGAQTPRIGGFRPGEAPGPEGSTVFDRLSPKGQNDTVRDMISALNTDPMRAARDMELWEAKGLPVEDVLNTVYGLTREEFMESVGEAQELASQVREESLVPLGEAPPSVADVAGEAERQAARAAEMEPIRNALANGSYAEVLEAARSALARDLMTRDQVLGAIKDPKMRDLIDARLQVRLQVVR